MDFITMPSLLVLPGGARGILPLIFFSYEKVPHRSSLLEASIHSDRVLFPRETSCEAIAKISEKEKSPLEMGIFLRHFTS